MFVPPNYDETLKSRKHKTILLYNGLGPWNVKQGRETFTSLKCPVYTCNLTANREAAHTADLVLYKDYFIPTGVARPPKQLFMLYFLECPYHTQHVKFPDAFNWTSTYRYVLSVFVCTLFYCSHKANKRIPNIFDKDHLANKFRISKLLQRQAGLELKLALCKPVLIRLICGAAVRPNSTRTKWW